jgi:phosphoribosylformimino-5-aminoimidazole carboxamide ribotide isomerase
MQIIPAIDLQNGRAVRLLRGDFERETVYGTDPAAVARRWREAGAELLHAVDLDGVRAGRPVQLDLVRAIAAEAPVQLGGGLRTREDIDAAIDAGVQRVVLGTAALDRALIAELAREHGDRLVVALDTRDGQVAVQGWTEASSWTMLELARELIDCRVRRFLHTDVERDGALTSPNFASLEALIALGMPVIASGGVADLAHIRRLREMGAEAAIVGRALYEGTVDLREAIALAG